LYNIQNMLNSIKKFQVASSAMAMSWLALLVAWITNSGWVMVVETADITSVNTANSNFLSSAFEILKFIPTIAMVAGWFYVLNKIFSLIPKAGWSK